MLDVKPTGHVVTVTLWPPEVDGGHMVNVMATSVERWQVPHKSKLYCLLPALV